MTCLSGLADLLLGTCCVACGAPGRTLCRECEHELVACQPRQVHRPVPGFPVVHAQGLHEAARRAAIIACKDRGAWGLADVLGGCLALAIASSISGQPVTVVPVPSRASAVRERGADTMRLIAVAAVRHLRGAGVPCVLRPVLRQRGGGADQAGLDRGSRLANMRRRIVSRPVRPMGEVVVVDDVVTTGASLVAAVAALRSVGVQARAAATISAAGWC